MGIIDYFNSVRDGLSKGVRTFNAADERAVDAKIGRIPNWFFKADWGIPRNINLFEVREFAKSTWVQMVTTNIIKRVTLTDWKFTAIDEDDDISKYDEQIKYATDFLNVPNRNKDTFSDVFGSFLRDVLEIDAGVIVKGHNASGDLRELWVRDGGTFLIKINETGVREKYFQYSLRNPSSRPIPFETDKVVYKSMNRSPELEPYGFSPLQSNQQIVEMMIQSTRFNKDFFLNNAIPNGIVTVEANEGAFARFKEYWKNEIKGKPHKLAVVNNPVDFKPLNMNNRDMEWLEGQKYYTKVIAAAYGLSLAELGFTEDVNKASQEGQERVSDKNAYRPYYSIIEDVINNEILPDLFNDNNLPFRWEWEIKDDQAEQREFEREMRELQQGVLTVNEVRSRRGLDELEETPEEEEQGAFGNPKKDEQKDEEEKKKLLSFLKKKSISNNNSNDFILNAEAKSYDHLLEQLFNSWEKRILSTLDLLKDEIETKGFNQIQKGFGDFLTNLFNTVTTKSFTKKLRLVVKKEMLKGLEEGEEELNLDIGVTEGFEQSVDVFKDRQLEGFHINGKKWNGIKGVARQVQVDIAEIVKNGLENKQGLNEIKKGIKDRMVIEKGGTRVTGEVTDGRAMRIARTETNRFRSVGKLQSYKDSGLKGRKQVVVIPMENHHKYCDPKNHDLAGQIQPLDKPFITKDGKEFMHPPFHTNCRSTIRMLLDEDN